MRKPKRFPRILTAALLTCCAVPLLLSSGCQSGLEELKQYETPSIRVLSPTLVEYTETFSFSGTEEKISHRFDNKLYLGNRVFSLSDVEYRVLSKEEETQEITEEVRYPGLSDRSFTPPDSIDLNRDGKTIPAKLTSMTYEAEEQSMEIGRSTTLSATTSFGYTTSLPNPASSKTIAYEDKATGQTVQATLPFVRMQTLEDWHWRSDVKIPITITTYDAPTYQLGDKQIPNKEEKPALSGYENDLLASLNLSPDRYRITDCVWDGEPYTNKDGELCRNAIATGERYVISCRAVFEGKVQLPPIQREAYTRVAVYTAAIPTGQANYQVEGIVTYQSIEGKEISIPLVVISVGAAVLILLGLFFLLVFLRRRKKEQE